MKRLLVAIPALLGAGLAAAQTVSFPQATDISGVVTSALGNAAGYLPALVAGAAGFGILAWVIKAPRKVMH